MRPYETMIERLTADHQEHTTAFEPFAGLGRASRLLLNLGRITHAELNDIELWPAALHGHDVIDDGPDVSKRITDEYDNPDVSLYGWQRHLTISMQDWYAFTHRNHHRHGAWIFDPPYSSDYQPILNTAYNLNAASTVIVFGPKSLADRPHRFWTAHEFEGPRQSEVALIRDAL